MTAALIQVCTDPRINIELIRDQVVERLTNLGLRADRVFILNEIGGNLGSNTRNTLDLLVRRREPVVLAAVLHHDDCLAAAAGMRTPLERTAAALRTLLAERQVRCPVLTGDILTETSALTWTDEPRRTYETLAFRMPRMFGEAPGWPPR